MPTDDRRPGEVCLFEYHCHEAHDSEHAELWYRSQQSVVVLGRGDDDAPEDVPTLRERIEIGMPRIYSIRFSDDHEADVFEDELLDSVEEYSRAAPPGRPRR